jgi:hypothetical protein
MNDAKSIILQIECRADIAKRIVAILEWENSPQIAMTAAELEELERDLLKQAHELCGLVVEKQIRHSIATGKSSKLDNIHLPHTALSKCGEI